MLLSLLYLLLLFVVANTRQFSKHNHLVSCFALRHFALFFGSDVWRIHERWAYLILSNYDVYMWLHISDNKATPRSRIICFAKLWEKFCSRNLRDQTNCPNRTQWNSMQIDGNASTMSSSTCYSQRWLQTFWSFFHRRWLLVICRAESQQTRNQIHNNRGHVYTHRLCSQSLQFRLVEGCTFF